MYHHRTLSGLCLLLLPVVVLAQNSQISQPSTNNPAVTQPNPQLSLEFLEFLADFGDLDDQTYDLIEFHALQDEKKSTQESSDER